MKTFWKVILVVFTVLIVLYILLPFILRDYVNKTINNLEGYQGRIEGVDLSIIRGGYAVKGLMMERTEEDEPIEYLEIERMSLSIEYRQLFKGKVVGDVHLKNPIIHVVPVDVEPDTTDWVAMIQDLLPIRINRFEVENGRINFVDFQTDPRVNVYLHDLNLVALNLSNIEARDDLPSTAYLTGTSVGGGNLEISMRADFLREIPNLDLELTFEEIDMTAFNNMTQAYANFQFDTGALNLYSEIAIREGIINGYITPVVEEVQILSDNPDQEKGLFQRLWEGALDVAASVLESPPDEEHIATRVEVYGDLNDPETPIWPVIVNTLRNAFVEAFEKGLEGSIDFEEVAPEGQ